MIMNKRNLFVGVLPCCHYSTGAKYCYIHPLYTVASFCTEGGSLEHLYYGSRTSDTDIHGIYETTHGVDAYPAYGMKYPGETALSVCHADGNLTLQMVVESVKETHLQEENATLTVIELKDKVYPFYVNVCYKAWLDADVIETWAEIRHEEKKYVQLHQFASAYLPIRRGNVWLSHLSGAWANEGRLSQEMLQPGMKVIKNTDGVRNTSAFSRLYQEFSSLIPAKK